MEIARYQNWKKKDIKFKAKHLAEKCPHLSVYIINQMLIFKFDLWEVVDGGSLTIVCFSTESEALNYCLNSRR